MTADWSNTSPAELLESHLNRPTNTSRNYALDLHTFAEFLGVRGNANATEFFVNLPRGAARRTIDNYIAWLRRRYPAVNTIRRKVSSVMGLLTLAHEYDVIPWAIKRIKLPSPVPIRDTRGPGKKAVMDLMAAASARGDSKGLRDNALFCLQYYSALRCDECLTLDVRHLLFDTHEIEVLGKGLWERTLIPIAMQTVDALKHWIVARGELEGPLFTTLKPGKAHTGERLTYPGLYSMYQDYAKRIGIGHVRPHGLRHTAASEISRLTNGNVNFGIALTRHRDPKTFMVYNDPRMSMAREATEILAAGYPVHPLDDG